MESWEDELEEEIEEEWDDEEDEQERGYGPANFLASVDIERLGEEYLLREGANKTSYSGGLLDWLTHLLVIEHFAPDALGKRPPTAEDMDEDCRRRFLKGHAAVQGIWRENLMWEELEIDPGDYWEGEEPTFAELLGLRMSHVDPCELSGPIRSVLDEYPVDCRDGTIDHMPGMSWAMINYFCDDPEAVARMIVEDSEHIERYLSKALVFD